MWVFTSQYHIATANSMVIGHKWLYDIPKILHRDISVNNLMVRKEGDEVFTVLNDFDLAVSVDIKSMSSKHRTGTKPFVAIDLLGPDPTVHMYCHDLESMFYVLVWITSRFHDGKLELSLTGLQTSYPGHFSDDTFNDLVTFDSFQKVLGSELQ